MKSSKSSTSSGQLPSYRLGRALTALWIQGWSARFKSVSLHLCDQRSKSFEVGSKPSLLKPSLLFPNLDHDIIWPHRSQPMPGTRKAAGVRDNFITALFAQSEGDQEVQARLIPRIYRELLRLPDLSCSEIVLILRVSCRTPKRDWIIATTWLKRELSVQP
jgi:hypothetical protein